MRFRNLFAVGLAAAATIGFGVGAASADHQGVQTALHGSPAGDTYWSSARFSSGSGQIAAYITCSNANFRLGSYVGPTQVSYSPSCSGNPQNYGASLVH